MSTTVASEGDLLPTEGLAYLPPVPDQGQVVEVRGSTWAVADVRQQGLPRSPADEAAAAAHHVVTLQSLDEDRLGEELTVVWELEVGHTVAPDQGLPETIDAEASTTRTRWPRSSTRSAGVRSPPPTPNAYQAPFRSGANVEAYQLEPLRRALQAPRTNLLLADDVGPRQDHRGRAGRSRSCCCGTGPASVIIVCPPSLALKWQDEMREKFGLDFVIVNSELMAAGAAQPRPARQPVPAVPAGDRQHGVAADAARPAAAARRLRARSAQRNTARRFAFDVLVVDEAHHVAPASPTRAGGGRGLRRRQSAHGRDAGAGRAVRAPAVPVAPPRTTGTRSRSPRCWR